MASVTAFAAIDVGSYELELTIYEISPKRGIVQLERLRKVIGLGMTTFNFLFQKILHLITINLLVNHTMQSRLSQIP
ncbi:MAG: hypothetical protein HFI65_08135, partial [Lachnospiraceae bacterium]|nr:hypothetical protein [Lachnospiraceae bacterium]